MKHEQKHSQGTPFSVKTDIDDPIPKHLDLSLIHPILTLMIRYVLHHDGHTTLSPCQTGRTPTISTGRFRSSVNHPIIPCRLATMISILLESEAPSVLSVEVLVRLDYRDLVLKVDKEGCSWIFVVGGEEVD